MCHSRTGWNDKIGAGITKYIQIFNAFLQQNDMILSCYTIKFLSQSLIHYDKVIELITQHQEYHVPRCHLPAR